MSINIISGARTGSNGTKTAPRVAPSNPTGPSESAINLIKVMETVQTDTPEAKLNETSISDNNGGRIELNEPRQSGTIMGSIKNRQW